MKLKNLLKGISYEVIQGSDDINIDNICWDSRSVSPNSLFICVKNKNIDRHDYANQATKKGAIALLIENDICNSPSNIAVIYDITIMKNITIIKTKNSRKAMALIANKFYGGATRCNMKSIA